MPILVFIKYYKIEENGRKFPIEVDNQNFAHYVVIPLNSGLTIIPVRPTYKEVLGGLSLFKKMKEGVK